MTDPALAALQHWLDTHPAPPMPRDASDYDEDTLRRSFGLSATARREQRRPAVERVDEYGYDRRGTYYADRDGAA